MGHADEGLRRCGTWESALAGRDRQPALDLVPRLAVSTAPGSPPQQREQLLFPLGEPRAGDVLVDEAELLVGHVVGIGGGRVICAALTAVVGWS